MPKVFKVICVDISDEEMEVRRELRKQFPPGTLENLDTAFLQRCKMSPMPGRKECIVYCMSDGRTPEEYEDQEITADVKPTFKGFPPKRYSFAGKHPEGIVPLGVVITQRCGYKHCVNQQHLELTGRTTNQYLNTGSS